MPCKRGFYSLLPQWLSSIIYLFVYHFYCEGNQTPDLSSFLCRTKDQTKGLWHVKHLSHGEKCLLLNILTPVALPLGMPFPAIYDLIFRAPSPQKASLTSPSFTMRFGCFATIGTMKLHQQPLLSLLPQCSLL